MAGEAIVDVIRTGSDASRVISDLDRETRKALDGLGQINPAVQQAVKAYEGLRRQQQQGNLTPDEQSRLDVLTASLISQANAFMTARGPRGTDPQSAPQSVPTEQPEPQKPTPAPPAPLDRLEEPEKPEQAEAPEPPESATESQFDKHERVRRETIERLRAFEEERARKRAEEAEAPPPPGAPPAPAPAPGSAPVPPRPEPATVAAPAPPDVKRMGTAELRARIKDLEKEIGDMTPRFGQGDTAGGTSDPQTLAMIEKAFPALAHKRKELEILKAEDDTRREEELHRREEIETRAAERRADQARKEEQAKRLAGNLDADLLQRWTDQQRSLKDQRSEIEGLERTYNKLSDEKRRGIVVDDDALTRTREQISAAHERRRATIDELEAIKREAKDRNIALPTGDDAEGAGGGGSRWKSIMRAALAGAGLGGGGFTGMITGAMFGSVALPGAIAGGLALAIGKVVSMSIEGYNRRVAALETTIPLSAASGGRYSPEDLLTAARLSSDILKLFGANDVIAAQRTLQQGTGSLDLGNGTATVALLTGRGLPEQASVASRLAPLSRRIDPELSLHLLAGYERSVLGYDGGTALIGQFEQLLPQLAASQTTPFSRVDMGDVVAQLSAASRISLPGVENPIARTEIGASMLAGRNRFMQGLGTGNDVFADISYLAMRRLRGSDVAKDLLKNEGIDLNDPLGIAEALERITELEHSYPELTKALNGAMEEFIPDKKMRGYAIYDKTGSAYLTRKIMSGELDRAAGAKGADLDEEQYEWIMRNPPPMDEEAHQRWLRELTSRFGYHGTPRINMESRAVAIEQMSASDEVYQSKYRQENQQLSMGEIVDGLGSAITRGMGDIRDGINSTLAAILLHHQVPGTEHLDRGRQ